MYVCMDVLCMYECIVGFKNYNIFRLGHVRVWICDSYGSQRDLPELAVVQLQHRTAWRSHGDNANDGLEVNTRTFFLLRKR